MKKNMLWISVAFLLLGAFADDSYALDITVDTVWPAGTYVMSNHLIIKSGATLTIQNGAIVKFTADGLLWVQDGALDASGVTFTWNDIGNEWQGIYLASPAAGNRLENCVIEHAKGRSAGGDRYAMVIASASSAGPGEPRITECTIGNGSANCGISVSAQSAQILNNTISGFSNCGVYVSSPAIDAMVTGNQFQNNAAGVHIQYNTNTSPTVTANTYSGSTETDLRISYNTIAITVQTNWNEASGTIYRLVDGFGIGEGGRLSISEGIIVALEADGLIWVQTGVLEATGVTFTWADGINEWQGIQLASPAAGNRLENCVIEHAKGRSTYGYAMVIASASSAGPGEPRITGCTIGNGTALRGIHVTAPSPQIIHNTLSGFSDYGIYFSASSSPFITGNTITGNKRGIGAFSSKSGVSRVNRIEGNTEYGFFTGESYIYSDADARYNWWGSSTGPTFAGNPGGAGDSITTKVDYFPFYGSITDSEPDDMWDDWEVQQFTNLTTASATSDYDLDGLLDKDEFLYGTDPKNRDSDSDGVEDGLEVQVGMNPSLAGDYNIDSDGDTYSNLREIISGTDPYSAASVPPVLADGDPLPFGDGDVDGKEIAAFIAEYGRTNCSPCKYDLDTDGDVDLADLFLFSEDFGRTAP